jgi:hypothetical protein
MTHPDSAWVPQWPECTIELPDYPRLPLDPSYWTWRIPESDIRAWEEAAAARRREAEERERRRQERQERDARQAAEIREGLARIGRGEVPGVPPGPALEVERPQPALSPLRAAVVEACQRLDAGGRWTEVLHDVEHKYSLPLANRETLATYMKRGKRPKWLQQALAVTTSP